MTSQDIAIQPQIEEKLKLYKAIIANAKDGIAIVNEQGFYLEQNTAHYLLLNYSNEELEGKKPTIHLGETTFALMMEALQQYDTYQSEVCSMTKNGTIVDLDLSAFTVRDRQGKLLYYVINHKDISCRKHTEATQKNCDRLLAGVAAATNHLLTIADFTEAINQALADLGKACGIDRVYIFESDRANANSSELSVNRSYEWCQFSVESQIDCQKSKNLPYSSLFPQWYETLASGKPISNLAQNFPTKEREILAAQNIISVLLVPILISDEFWGFIGFDDCHGERLWTATEQSILATTAASIGSVIVRRRTLTALHQSEQNYRALVNNLKEVIFTTDARGCWTFLNPAWTEVTGFSIEETIGKNIFDYLHPEDRCISLDLFKSLTELQRDRCHCERRFLTIDSGYCWVEIYARSLVDSEGKFIGISGTLNNITDQTSAEEALGKSEAKNRALLDAIPDLIFKFSTDGTIIDFKASKDISLDVKPNEFLGKKIRSVFSPEIAQKTMFCIEKTIDTGEAQAIEFQLLIQGKVRDCEARIVASDDEVISIVRDITERKQIESALRESKEAAEAGSRAKSEFLATMSHELRTPLNAILGLSHLLQQEIFGEVNPKQKEYIDCIHSSGEHLLALINDILDLSKVEAGREELVHLPIDVKELSEVCLTLIRDRAVAKGLQLIYQIDPQISNCIGDERRIKQMLLNLLSNAVKFTSIGTVSLRVQKVSSGIAFTVTDTGIGIDQSQIKYLFQPFQQLDSRLNRQYEGTGLGLALTRKLAQLHGGDVTVQSTPGKGSQFTLHLPTEITDSSLFVNNLFSEQQQITLQAAKRILIVEDDECTAMLLQDYLEAIGYEIEYTAETSGFLERVRNFQPHLILLDVQLRDDVTGLDLVSCLRSSPDLQQLPVVMVTAMAMVGDRDLCLEAGANDYLSKPFGIPQLESILMRYLN